MISMINTYCDIKVYIFILLTY